MTLFILILWFLVGGILAWWSGRWHKELPRWVSVITVGTHLIAVLTLWGEDAVRVGQPHGPWLAEVNVPWIPQLGIHAHLALDGLSLLLIVLSNLLGLMAVGASWTAIQERVGFFHFNLMWILAALVGVFLAIDLFFFYFFWEMMLVPLYFLIGIWGHENRIYATLKFFIFTQASGLLMLLAILGLYFVHGRNTGVYTFDYMQLLDTQMSPTIAFWLMLGFFIAFGVKLPAVPLHTWLPDAHAQAPTGGSIDLAGLVLKVGAYGFIRFLIPLFPEAAFSFAPVAMALGVIGIIYGAVVAFSQTDIKRLVAYTSVSHMGFVLIGIFAWNQLALQGALVLMIAHGISTSALFILVGDLYERVHTRDMNRMGGLWSTIPRMGGSGLLFAMAALGLPGLGDFIGEFLVLLGVFQVNVPIAVLATLGFIVSTVYALWMIQRTFFGPNKENWQVPDATGRELLIMAVMAAIIVWLGLFPQTVLNTGRHALETMQEYTLGTRRQAAVPAENEGTLWQQLQTPRIIQAKPAEGDRP